MMNSINISAKQVKYMNKISTFVTAKDTEDLKAVTSIQEWKQRGFFISTIQLTD